MQMTVTGPAVAVHSGAFFALRVPCPKCRGQGERCGACDGAGSISIDITGSELRAEHLALVLPEARLRAIETLCARGAALEAENECLTHALHEAHRALAQARGARHSKRMLRVVAGAMRAVRRWRDLAFECGVHT